MHTLALPLYKGLTNYPGWLGCPGTRYVVQAGLELRQLCQSLPPQCTTARGCNLSVLQKSGMEETYLYHRGVLRDKNKIFTGKCT